MALILGKAQDEEDQVDEGYSVDLIQSSTKDLEAGSFSDDESNWEPLVDSRGVEIAEAVPQENESVSSVERKIHSILRSEPQIFTVNDTPKKRNKKRTTFRSQEVLHNRKCVVFQFPEGMPVPERTSVNHSGEKAPFPDRARKTLLILRKKLSGEKEEIPWRASAHCSPSLLKQRNTKIPKDFYLQAKKEIFVRSFSLSDDEEDEGRGSGLNSENDEGGTTDSQSFKSNQTDSEGVFSDSVLGTSNNLTGSVTTEGMSNDDEEEEYNKPSRRQSLRMQLHALQTLDQISAKASKKATFKTGGHGLGHGNPKATLARRSKKSESRQQNLEPNENQENVIRPSECAKAEVVNAAKSPDTVRKISASTKTHDRPVRKISWDNTAATAVVRQHKVSRDNHIAGVKQRKISKDNSVSRNKARGSPVRKISRDNTAHGAIQRSEKTIAANSIHTGPIRKISRDNNDSCGGTRSPKISRDHTVQGETSQTTPARKISRDNATQAGRVRKISRDNAMQEKVHSTPGMKLHHARKGGQDNNNAVLESTEDNQDSVNHTTSGEHQSRRTKKVHPFKYINAKIAMRLAQRFSGSESDGERSRSGSRHNSVSMSDDSITSILDSVLPPPSPPSTSTPGKIVRTRYRKISREEAKPYAKDASDKPPEIL